MNTIITITTIKSSIILTIMKRVVTMKFMDTGTPRSSNEYDYNYHNHEKQHHTYRYEESSDLNSVVRSF